jgi:hypothetical protein
LHRSGFKPRRGHDERGEPGATHPPSADDAKAGTRWLPDLEVLFETARDLASTLSSRVVIDRLIDRTLVHLDSEIASVLLTDAGGFLRISHTRGLPEVVVADVETHPRFRRRNHERYYIHSCI